jgi:hypothetical protein
MLKEYSTLGRRIDPIPVPPLTRRQVLFGAGSASALALLSGCTSNVQVGPAAVAGQQPDATVEMRMVQAAYIGSANAGSGVLDYRGRRYPFNVGGAGIGGIGASEIEATGSVYNLRDVAQFAGAYGEARYGFALGQRSAGELWLQNEAGVIMRLNARREGLMLSLGGDAVVISMT